MPSPHLRTRVAAAVAALALGASLSACGASGAATTNEDGDVVLRYQGGPGLMNYVELADALGYFENIDLDYVGAVQGGPESLRALATDQTDFAGGPFLGATVKVIESGVDLKAVVAAYGTSGDTTMSLLVKEGSGIRSGKDLVGKKIAVNTLGANSEAVIDTYLKAEGLSPEEIAKVTLVPLPGVSQESSLRDGQVDAALMAFATKNFALSNGGLEELAVDKDYVGEYNGGATVFRSEFIEENPEIVEEFVAGVAKAIEFDRTEGRERTVEVYSDWLADEDRAEEAKVYETWEGNGIPSEGGVLSEHDWEIWLEWLQDNGDVESTDIDVNKYFTNEFNPYAKGN